MSYISNMLLVLKKRKYESIIDSVGLTLEAQALKKDITHLEKQVARKPKGDT